MKGKKIFKRIVVSALTLAIMCSNIPVSAGSLPEENIIVTEEAPASEEPENEAPVSEEDPAGSEQSGPSAPGIGDALEDSTETVPTEEPSADTEEPEEPSGNDPVQDPADPSAEQPPAEKPEEPSAEAPEAPSTEAPEVPSEEQPETPPAEETPEEEQSEDTESEELFEEEDPLDFEDQLPIEDMSRLPDEEGTAATIWAARAPKAMLFALYDLDAPEEDEEKAWTFDTYYVNQADPYNVTKTSNFDLKYQMEFHASQDLAKGAVFIKINAKLYTDRYGNVILPTEIAVPEGRPDDPVLNRTTPFNYYIEEEGDETYLIFFNYKKIPSGSNAAWQVLYKNQKLMNIVDETPWTLTPQIRVDTGAKAPTEEEPQGVEAKPYNPETFEKEAEKRTSLTGRIDSSVSLTSVVKTSYSEPGRNYTPGLYTRAQVEKYINGNVPEEYLNSAGKLDTEHWRFVVWDVKLQGKATQPWKLSIKDIPFLSEDEEDADMRVIGYKDNSDVSTPYRLPIQAPYSSANMNEIDDLYAGVQYQESWGSRFYVVTAYPAERVVSGTKLQNKICATIIPGDGKDDPEEKYSTPASWSYADYDWHFEGDKIGISKQNGTGPKDDKTQYTGWLDAYQRSSEKGEDYGEIPFSTSSVMHGYSDTHRTNSGTEDGVSYTTGDYIPNTWYTFTTADDFVYLYTDEGKNVRPLTEKDYYFSQVSIMQKDYGYDVWEDERKEESELLTVDKTKLPEGIFTNGSEVRIYAMLAKSDGTHVKDAQGWELVHTGHMDLRTGQFAFQFNEDLLEQQPYRIKVEHDSIDFESHCTINVNVRLRAIDKTAYQNQQIMAGVLEAHENTSRNEKKSPVIRLENLSGAMCRAYENGEKKTFYGFGKEDIEQNYEEPGLKEATAKLYPDLDAATRLPIRDNASRDLTWLNEIAQANKESQSTNDVNNNRVLVDYYLTAYDGYEIYDRSVLNYLKEEDMSLISPGRTHVVFYDLLPYGMQYDASTAPTAGRITDLDQNGYYKTRPNNWNKTQVSVVVDPERDIIPDYRGTGRTMVAFHVIYTGADATSYTAQKWIEGWGVTFRAYYDWKDINQINDVDINANLCAFMPDFSDVAGGSNDDHPSLCGLKSEVDYDDGTHGDDDENREKVEAAYADMVKEYIENGRTFFGNIDGYDPEQKNGKRFDETYRNVLYAKNSLSDNVATASSSKIETLVHADADRLGAFGPVATVPVSENPPAGSMMNLYTYDNTVTVKTNTTNIVIFNRLETAAADRQNVNDPFAPFTENPWSGTFREVDTSGLAKQGINDYTIYYSDRSDAPITKDNEEPKNILTEAKGWFTEAQMKEKHGDNWQQYVKAVAVDLKNTEVEANNSVSFRIKMTAPMPEDGKGIYTYNSASFSSVSKTDNTRSTVHGNSVRVCISRPETLEIIKKTSGNVPTALLDEQFEFHIYEEYTYEGETARRDLAYTEYKLFKQDKEGKWIQQTDQPYATNGSGYFYLHADEKAVFELADAEHLIVKETENVFWETQVSDQTVKSADGRRIGAADGDLRILTVTNIYRPVLYVQKRISSVPEGTELTEEERTFTFRIQTKGSDGKYHPVANAEYWMVDSVRLDGGIPTKLETKKPLKTNEKGEFTIQVGDIIALFPGTTGTQYELSEVIPSNTDWSWHCENSVLTGKLPSGGDSRTITNYYRWKDLRLKKEITHQSQEDYEQMAENTFTFRLFEAELDGEGKPVTDADGNPVAKKDSNGVLTTSGIEWVILDENGQESQEESDRGILAENGTFTYALGYRTVKFRHLDAGKIYIIEELADGIPEENGRKLYVPNNDTVEVKVPVYSTGKDVTITNDYQKRSLSVTKTVVGDNSGNDENAKAQSYSFRVQITRPQADGSSLPVPAAGLSYTVTKQGAEPRTGVLGENGTFTLSDGETAAFKDIGMLGDSFEVWELNNTQQIYPANQGSHTGTLSGDGAEISFVNGASGSLLISKEYTGLDETGKKLTEQLKDFVGNNNWDSHPDNWDPSVRLILNIWIDGEPYKEDIKVTEINQFTGETSEENYITAGAPFFTLPWKTISIPVGGESGIPANAVYTLEEVEENRMVMYEQRGLGEAAETNWMQISQSESSKVLKTEKSVSERPVAVICNEISTLPGFTGTEIGKYMTPASSEVPEGAKLVWRVERYDAAGSRWIPAEGISYAVFTDCYEPVSGKIEKTGADGRILLVKQEGYYPIVHFQEDQVYLNLYKAGDIERLSEELAEGKQLLRMVEVPEESDGEWGLLAGYTYNPKTENPETRRKAARDVTQDGMVPVQNPYSMDAAPELTTGFMNSNTKEALEIEKKMSEASDTRFTMILEQVLSAAKEPIAEESDIIMTRPGAGISYTVLKADGTRVNGVTGPKGELELYAGERAVLNIPEGTRWTVHEQTFLTPNYKLAGLTPDYGEGGGRLTKLKENLMLVDIPASEQYMLIFDDNGGSGGPGTLTQVVNAGESAVFTIPGICPVRKGYTFVGWSEIRDADSEDLLLHENNAYSVSYGSSVLYAVWEKVPSYAVVYTDGVEGKFVFDDQITEDLIDGDKTPKFSTADGTGIPEREGYVFGGWTPAVAETINGEHADENGKIIYTATWKKTYSVVYRDESGAFGGETYGKIAEGTNTPQYDNGKIPTREGYTFAGWSPVWKEKVSGKEADNEGKIIYTACWVKEGTPLYRKYHQNDDCKNTTNAVLQNHVNGGKITLDPKWCFCSIDGKNVSFKLTSVTIGEKTYDGETVEGWIKSGFIEIPPECAGEIDNFSLRYDAVEAQSSAD